MMGPMNWGQGMEWMGGGMWIGPILMTALWVALIAGIIWLAIALMRQGRAPASTSALRILEDRLARGEIDLEEFNTRKAAIAQLA